MTVGQIALGVVGGVAGFFTGGAGWALVGLAMGLAAGSLLDSTKSDMPGAGTPQMQELDMPTVEEGVSIYDLLGTSKVVGQLLWYGKSHSVAITQKVKGGKGGGGKSSKQTVGYNYYLSWAQGICLGPVDVLYTVFRDEEIVWSGYLEMPESGGEETITLEGMGSMTLYFGTDDHVANALMGAEVGVTANPSYRNLCWAYFDDILLGTYNRAPRMRFILKKRPSYSFNIGYAIGDYDYNAAHAIYHFLTNSNYIGLPETWINTASFSDFADLMLEVQEQHGISMLMTRQEGGMTYIENVLSHIGAVLRYGIDGKFHLHALRANTPVSQIPEITQDDFLEPMTLERKGWTEVLNEVQVQHHIRYDVLSDQEVEAGGFNPDDNFPQSDTQPPDPDKWTVNFIAAQSDTAGVNPPAIDGNRLWWTGTKAAEGSGEELYRVIGKFWFAVGQDAWEMQADLDWDVLTAAGDPATGYGALLFGITSAQGSVYPQNEDYVYVASNGAGGIYIAGYAGVGASVSYSLTELHFPLKVKIRREKVSTVIRTGIIFFNRLTGQWMNFSGTVDTYWWGANETDWRGFPLFQFSSQSSALITSSSFVGGAQNFTVLEGSVGCYVDGEELAGDTFDGEDGDQPNTDLWVNESPTVFVLSGNRLKMPLDYYGVGIYGKCYFGGDFDIQVDCQVIPYMTSDGFAIFEFWFDTYNHAQCSVGKMSSGDSAPKWKGVVTVTGYGNSTEVKSAGYLPNEDGSVNGKFRITRVGQICSTYYYGYPDAGWNLMASRSDFPLGDGYIRMREHGMGGTPYDAYWNNFVVNAGKVRECLPCTAPSLVPGGLDIRRGAVSGDDRGTAEIQGRAITSSVQLMGFGTTENANWAADRAVRRAAYPYAEGQLVCNRSVFKYEVGDLFKLSDSENEISNMICRVNRIGEGSLDSEAISITFMEEPDYVTSGTTLAEADTEGASRNYGLEVLTKVGVIEAPYAIVGDKIAIIPLAGREVGSEIGYEVWESIDGGASYQFLDNIIYYAVWGSLVSELNESVLTLDKINGFEIDFYLDSEVSRIETVTREQLFNNANLSLLGEEILGFETITPDPVVAGRYAISGLNRGKFDSIRETWPIGTEFWYTGNEALGRIESLNFLKGATIKFKLVPYNEHFVGNISEAIVIEHTFVGRAKAPYTPANFNASGRSQNPTYQRNVYLDWDSRVRGADAGISAPNSVVDVAAYHEGKFEVKVYDSGGMLVRTATDLETYAWTYSESMNIADNGALEESLTFTLANYIDASGVRYTSIHLPILGVVKNAVTTTTTITITMTTTTTTV